MLKRTLRILNSLTLVLITLAAVGVMWMVSRRGTSANQAASTVASPLPEAEQPKPRVAVEKVSIQTWPVYSVYTGKIQPWETYTVGFEISGRVAVLGTNVQGNALDEGDVIADGAVLARLDDEILRRRVEEASARRELAESEKLRADRLRARESIQEAEHLRRVTEAAEARAKHQIAEQQLIDATLLSPASGKISRRQINVGESVAANVPAFEIVEDARVLLVVEVPEAEIRELEQRYRQVETARAKATDTAAEADLRAIVYLEGRDRFGERWPPVEGRVYHIAEVANPQSGTFEVEIELSNEDGMLRPGMVATAWIETSRVRGYRLSEDNLVFRHNRAHVFTVEEEPSDVRALYWKVGQFSQFRARRVAIRRFIEQRPLPSEAGLPGDDALPSRGSPPDLIIPAEESSLQRVVVRGQHRLSDGQLVRVVNRDEGVLGGERSQAAQNPVGSSPPKS